MEPDPNARADRGRWIPRIIVLFTGLAPLWWFRSGYPIKGVDSFFSLHPQGVVTRGVSFWDARSSTGEPARVLTVFIDLVQGGLAKLGLPVAAIEALILCTLALSAAFGMYAFYLTLREGSGLTPVDRYVAAAVAVAWVANPFALSFVWWHQLLLEVTWAALPWLLALLIRATRQIGSPWRAGALAGLITIGGVAGFHEVDLPFIALLLAVYAAALVWDARSRRSALIGTSIVGGSVAAGLVWWLVPTMTILPALYSEQAIGPFPAKAIDVLDFASRYASWPNIFSLTAEPELHQTYGGFPYVSWIGRVTGVPGSALKFVLPATALVGLAVALRARSSRAVAVAAAISIVLGAFIAKGTRAPFGNLNALLLELPFGAAFRHPYSKAALLVVPSLCVLFGFGLDRLVRQPKLRPLAVLAVGTVCVHLALPWWSGSVVPVGGGLVPSAHAEMPSSYNVVGRELGRAPVGGKTFVLPYADDAQAAFVWAHGVQPNTDCLLQDWQPARSLLCKVSPQRYAARVGAVVVNGVQRRDPRVFDLARLWGIDRWVVHEDWASSYFAHAVGPENANVFLDGRGAEARPQLSERAGSFPGPRPGQDIEFDVRIDQPPDKDDQLLRVGEILVQVNRSPQFLGRPIDGQVFFSLRDPRRDLWVPGSAVQLSQWHVIRLRHTTGQLQLLVDGVPQGVPLRCRPTAADCQLASAHIGEGITAAPPVSVEVIGPPRSGGARLDMTSPRLVRSSDPSLATAPTGWPAHANLSTAHLRVWQQAALPLVYTADSTAALANSASSDTLLAAAAEVRGDQRPALLPAGLSARRFDTDANTTWTRRSASQFSGTLHGQGQAILVFSQSFDPRWRLNVDGKNVARGDHFVVNGFANGWAVPISGSERWTLTYTTEPSLHTGFLIGAVLAILAVLGLLRLPGRSRWLL